MHLPEDFQVQVLKPGEKFGWDYLMELRPTKLLIFPNGAKDNTASYAFLLEGSMGTKFIAQISNTMLVEALHRVGQLDRFRPKEEAR